MTGNPLNDAALCFEQVHIDAARNSTDDFNPFHTPQKYFRIQGNPYHGTIVLGFQLECLIEYQVEQLRDRAGETAFIQEHGLHFSNYQLTFANALLPGEPFQVEIKPTLARTDPPSLSNRVVIRKQDAAVMLGHKKESTAPLYLPDYRAEMFPPLRGLPDRDYLPGGEYFLKRKFMNTANAKNFVVGSLGDQSYYFDELEERVHFPDIFPAALISCALLEKAMHEKHDFMKNPMVYVSHNISVDRRLAGQLRSDDVLHLLVQGPERIEGEKGLGKSELVRLLYRCFGIVNDGEILYRAEVLMAPLASITGKS